MDLEKKILQVINKHQYVRSGDTVVVGVSGGADSMALLYVLYQLRHPLGINLHVAHFNHRLRPKADHDEAYVKNFCSKLSLPTSVAYRKGFLKSSIISEDKARQWRFDFFQKVARETKAQSVALAHTQNDLAETVLMRLLRGAGLMGLRGILSEHQIGTTKFIRPFLSIQRKQIEQYLKTHKIRFCMDETNRQTHYLRNKIRLKLLPSLVKEYNPNVPNTLVDLAYTAQADYDYLLGQAQGLFKKNAKFSKNIIKLNFKFYFKQYLCMRRMLLRLAYEYLVADFNQLSFSHIEEVEDMALTRPVGSIVHWPRSIQVLKSTDAFIFSIRK